MEGKKYEVVKFKDDEVLLEVNVSPKENTIWLKTEDIAILFGVNRPAINKHIINILNEKELDESTCSIMEQVHNEGNRIVKRMIKIYNLDMIISIGYRVNSKKGIFFRRWANNVLKEYLLRGYVINENRTLVTNENYLELINKINSIDNRVLSIENELISKDIPTEKIFYSGEAYDAYSLLQQIFARANNEIIIIDNFTDRTILDRLVGKKQNVKVIIYTDPVKSSLLGIDIKTFNKQYPTLDVRYTNDFHDRFIIIDRTILYLVGASLKDAGKKCFAIIKMNNNTMLINLIKQYNF